MTLNIKATHTSLTDAIRQTIEEKLSAIETMLRPEDVVRVELAEDVKNKDGLFSRVEVHISPSGHYAEARGHDFYEAVDLVLPKIKEQITRQKDKRISLRRKLGSLFKRFR